jgi:hypothetical protein
MGIRWIQAIQVETCGFSLDSKSGRVEFQQLSQVLSAYSVQDMLFRTSLIIGHNASNLGGRRSELTSYDAVNTRSAQGSAYV